jgi:hypothetical protein
MPLQLRCPGRHSSLQARLLGMQAPSQGIVPCGHSDPHLIPSQVALPPAGTGQGLHETPQLVIFRSLRHASPQR